MNNLVNARSKETTKRHTKKDKQWQFMKLD